MHLPPSNSAQIQGNSLLLSQEPAETLEIEMASSLGGIQFWSCVSPTCRLELALSTSCAEQQGSQGIGDETFRAVSSWAIEKEFQKLPGNRKWTVPPAGKWKATSVGKLPGNRKWNTPPAAFTPAPLMSLEQVEQKKYWSFKKKKKRAFKNCCLCLERQLPC